MGALDQRAYDYPGGDVDPRGGVGGADLRGRNGVGTHANGLLQVPKNGKRRLSAITISTSMYDDAS